MGIDYTFGHRVNFDIPQHVYNEYYNFHKDDIVHQNEVVHYVFSPGIVWFYYLNFESLVIDGEQYIV